MTKCPASTTIEMDDISKCEKLRRKPPAAFKTHVNMDDELSALSTWATQYLLLLPLPLYENATKNTAKTLLPVGYFQCL
ncbi:hypothetical protein TNCV_3159771 [Trichonephila clavipes]|nr:hypothetical protein TNCV_3159771 [Trichonephila clavipes]